MPRVETYTGDRVKTQPLPGSRRTAVPTPETFGAGFGQVLGAVSGEAARIRAEQDRRATELVQMTGERMANDIDQLTLYAQDVDPRPVQDGGIPHKGLLHQTGKDPQDNLQAMVEAWDTQWDEVLKIAKTPAQRAVLEQMRDRRRAVMLEQSGKHASVEWKKYETGEFNAALTSSVNTSVAAVGTEGWVDVVQSQLRLQESLIAQNAAKFGMGPQAADEMTRKLRSETHVGVINRLSDEHKDIEANEYFETVTEHSAQYPHGQIDEHYLKGLREKLKRNSTEALAYAYADRIFRELGPAPGDEQSPVGIDRMLDRARDLAGKNPDLYKLMAAYLRERESGIQEGRQNREAHVTSTLWTAYSQRVPLDQVRLMPEFSRADGTTQTQIVNGYETRARQEQNDRDAALSGDYTRIMRQNALRDLGRDDRYWQLSSPESIRYLKPEDLPQYERELGPERYTRLAEKVQQYQADAHGAATLAVERDMFNEEAYNGGVSYAYTPLGQQTTTQRERMGRLQSAVENQISVEEERLYQSTGKRRKLGVEEQRAVTRRVVKQKVMIDGFWSDKEMIAAMLKEDEWGYAYVPFDQIPSAVKLKMHEFIRTLPVKAGTTPTRTMPWQEINTRYRQAMEKAWAAALRGGDDASWQALLRQSSQGALVVPTIVVGLD